MTRKQRPSRIAGYIKQADAGICGKFVSIVDDTQHGRDLSAAVQKDLRSVQNQWSGPHSSAMQSQSADSYYDVLENKITPYSNAYDKALADFRAYAVDNTRRPLSRRGQRRSIQLTVIVAAFVVAMTIALSWRGLHCRNSLCVR